MSVRDKKSGSNTASCPPADLGLKLEALAVSVPAQGPQSTSGGIIDSTSKSKAAPEFAPAASPARRPPEASYRSPMRNSQLPRYQSWYLRHDFRSASFKLCRLLGPD